MASLGFSSFIPNPLEGTSAAENFATLSGSLNFSINALLYFLYAFSIVLIGWNFFQVIYSYYGAESDSTKNFEKLSGAFLNAFWISLGIMMMVGGRFLISNFVRLLGISDVENPFLHPL
ncbi:hypothetical protein CO058_00045 [candidate division WWE3 bacterium CG_4_9_14_0_2_um_filter_35_11]|uniref:Uncharacterized protein n=1 Tax=candidate division WWE3 bacterium CG_4_9_14_0_2_um_filter_35_11 TaxID=1975077 RepID=A0A2M8EMW1_UNCKA|nr:MAG: hypothetical protein COV25_00045 [candidate division WWE3 bacterium CG10_big_fil_rev_8_21_14_0_10_35_32]PJC24076.1 MAG: hypothetical protein CO058_00045 [candidate division WWE3 bacterium CG_4_9_14_0_2_um_filter_35_11]